MKGRSKKLALLLAGCMVVGLTACGQAGKDSAGSAQGSSTGNQVMEEQSADASGSDGELTKITLMTGSAGDEQERQLYENQKKLFEEMYPGIELDIVEADMGIENGKLTTMLNSGIDLPDVMHINAGPARVGLLASSGCIIPLDDLYDKNGWEEKLNPSAYALCSRVDGKIYEVPNSMDSIGFFYNKEIFDELNLAEPTTWEDFIDICETTKEAGYDPNLLGGMDGYAVGWTFGNILQSTLGMEDITKLSEGNLAWSDPKVVKALETMKDFVEKGYIPSDCTSLGEADAQYAFLDGKSAMYVSGAWLISGIYDSGIQDKIGFFVLPSQVGEDACPTSGLNTTYVVPAGLDSTAGAEKWFEFLLSDEYAQMMAEEEMNNNIYASKAFSEMEVKSPLLQKLKDAVSQRAGRNISVFIQVETKNAYYQNLQGILAGIVTPKEAGANIQAGQEKDAAGSE